MTLMHCRRSIPLLAAAAALACVIGGCATASDREAYFESRSAVIVAQPGTGTSRMAVWPAGTWRSTVAVADRRTASDMPVAPSDSTR
jgi:hypothetical protein